MENGRGKIRLKTSEDISASQYKFQIRNEIPALLGIFIFVIVLLYPFTLGGKALMPDLWKKIQPWAAEYRDYAVQSNSFDAVLQLDPWFTYAQEEMKKGKVPHWNPWQFCGTPLYANRLVPFFHPNFVIACLVASPHRLLGWLQLLNLLVSGFGFYFLMRQWKFSRIIAFAGTCLWLTSTLHYLPHVGWTMASLGFPWIILALDSLIASRKIKYIGMGVFWMGLIMMSGYPVNIVHFCYFFVLYGIGRWFLDRNTGKPLSLAGISLVLAGVILFGIAFSAIANLPAYIYSQYTLRSIEGYQDTGKQREERLNILLPTGRSNDDVAIYHQTSFLSSMIPWKGMDRRYGGVLLYGVGFLGALGMYKRSRLVGLLWIFFAIPNFSLHAYLFYTEYLPGWGITIQPPFTMVNFIACLMAPYGLKVVIDGHKSLGVRFGKEYFLIAAIPASIISVVMIVNSPVGNLLASGTFFKLFVTGIVLAVGIISFQVASPKLYPVAGIMVTGILVLVSMGSHWYLQRAYSELNYMPDTPLTEWLKENATEGRIARWSSFPDRKPFTRDSSPLTPNRGMPLGLYDVGGYDALVPAQYNLYISSIEDSMYFDRALISFTDGQTLKNESFKRLGVRWIISHGEIPEDYRDGLTLRWDDRIDDTRGLEFEGNDFLQVWEIENFVPDITTVDPGSIPAIQSGWSHDGDWIIEKHDSGLIQMSMKSNNPGTLVLREGWYPEWKAYINDEEVKIDRVNDIFMGIAIPEGDLLIKFKYVPGSFYYGASISIFMLFVIILLVLSKKRLG